MLLPKVERKLETFDLKEREEKEAYDELLADPQVTILTKRWEKRRKESWDGDGGGVVDERFYLIIEYEQQSL